MIQEDTEKHDNITGDLEDLKQPSINSGPLLIIKDIFVFRVVGRLVVAV